MAQHLGFVPDRVVAGAETHTLCCQFGDHLGEGVVVLEQQLQARAEGHNLDIDLVGAVLLEQILGYLEHHLALDRGLVADL